jgi:dipeptidyl aminopeptidase/acylaminoacyl peptidase
MTRSGLVAAAAVLLLAGCSMDGDPDPAPGGTGDDEVAEVPGVLLDGDSAALSPDGSRLAVPCDGSICVWTTADGALAATFGGGTVVAWSPDGTTLATDHVTDDYVSAVLLDASTGADQGEHPAHFQEEVQDGPAAGLVDVQFSPDGEYLATVGADGLVRLFSLTDPSEEILVDPGGDAPVAVAWSPDGTRVTVASSDAPTAIVDAASGDEVTTLGDAPQGDVAWSPDGAVLATASFALDDDAATTIRDAESGEVEATLPRVGYRLAFRGDDQLVLSEKNEPGVLVWTWADDDVRTLEGAADMPRTVLVSPDARRIYAVSPRDGVLAWEADGGQPTTFDEPED